MPLSFFLAATYCIVIFALMLLSLLETILVTYLMDKTSPRKVWEISHCEDKGEKDDDDKGKSGQISDSAGTETARKSQPVK